LSNYSSRLGPISMRMDKYQSVGLHRMDARRWSNCCWTLGLTSTGWPIWQHRMGTTSWLNCCKGVRLSRAHSLACLDFNVSIYIVHSYNTLIIDTEQFNPRRFRIALALETTFPPGTNLSGSERDCESRLRWLWRHHLRNTSISLVLLRQLYDSIADTEVAAIVETSSDPQPTDHFKDIASVHKHNVLSIVRNAQRTARAYTAAYDLIHDTRRT
jgi:hypothetical protein